MITRMSRCLRYLKIYEILCWILNLLVRYGEILLVILRTA